MQRCGQQHKQPVIYRKIGHRIYVNKNQVTLYGNQLKKNTRNKTDYELTEICNYKNFKKFSGKYMH